MEVREKKRKEYFGLFGNGRQQKPGLGWTGLGKARRLSRSQCLKTDKQGPTGNWEEPAAAMA